MTCGCILHDELSSQSVMPAGGYNNKRLFCVTQKYVRVEWRPLAGGSKKEGTKR